MHRLVLAAGLLLGWSQPGDSRTVLVRQTPSADGIAPIFSYTGEVPAFNPIDQFYLHSNQFNPDFANGHFQPTGWNPAQYTGITCPAPSSRYQVAMSSAGRTNGHTTAQSCVATVNGIPGVGVVGAYLNPKDLTHGDPSRRQMIEPLVIFPALPPPFTGVGDRIRISFDLQVPYAQASDINHRSLAYVRFDLRFEDRAGDFFSISPGMFYHGGAPVKDGFNFDPTTQTCTAAPILPSTRHYVESDPGSQPSQAQTWANEWKHFSYTITYADFRRALDDIALACARDGVNLSREPADYTLQSAHLNAEIHYEPVPPSMIAYLGWSMANLTIIQN
jgi:hypothetical protein